MSVRILEGDALAVLRTLPDQSVQCCVTSPPYWGAQRDYGMPGQIGMEKTPELYAEALRAVFSEVKRVLRDDGTLWLNIGDAYAASGKGGGGSMMQKRGEAWGQRKHLKGWRNPPPGFKQKDLTLVPYMVADALRRDGWYLRAHVIWEKALPTEPTRADRPTVSFEPCFLFAKSLRYQYDPKAHPHGSVWRITADGATAGHSATMPVELARRLIASTTLEGQTALDPFSGAATTGLAASRLARNYVGIELNPEYAAMSRRRIHSDNPLFGDVA